MITLVELPLVLPPAVAGIALIAAFGRLGLLGGTFEALGITVGITQTAVVLAVTYVASPFYVRQAIASFEALDPSLLDASRTLGAGPARTFFRIALPLASTGLAAGAALSFARGIGEFGATIMFAGSLQGVTQTISLAIYAQFDLNFDVALALGALLVVASGVDPPPRQAHSRMDTLDLDVALPLRSFRLELALTVGARPSRSSGRPAPARRACSASSPDSRGPSAAESRSTAACSSTRRPDRLDRPRSAGSDSSSRSTRSSRT